MSVHTVDFRRPRDSERATIPLSVQRALAGLGTTPTQLEAQGLHLSPCTFGPSLHGRNGCEGEYMICYRDMTFCSAACLTALCPKRLTLEVRIGAARWWGSDGAPIASGDFSSRCPDYIAPFPKRGRPPKEAQ